MNTTIKVMESVIYVMNYINITMLQKNIKNQSLTERRSGQLI